MWSISGDLHFWNTVHTRRIYPFAVAADNNEAERELRPAVVTRKTSFGSHSKQYAHAFAYLLSLIRTWERQDLDFFEVAQQSISDHIISENKRVTKL